MENDGAPELKALAILTGRNMPDPSLLPPEISEIILEKTENVAPTVAQTEAVSLLFTAYRVLETVEDFIIFSDSWPDMRQVLAEFNGSAATMREFVETEMKRMNTP